jgi:predicted PhzF superfamily epimerase YddE/YHI9
MYPCDLLVPLVRALAHGVLHRVLDEPLNVLPDSHFPDVVNGARDRRPSLLYLRAEEDEDGETRVSVGGKVAMVACGELL